MHESVGQLPENGELADKIKLSRDLQDWRIYHEERRVQPHVDNIPSLEWCVDFGLKCHCIYPGLNRLV